MTADRQKADRPVVLLAFTSSSRRKTSSAISDIVKTSPTHCAMSSDRIFHLPIFLHIIDGLFLWRENSFMMFLTTSVHLLNYCRFLQSHECLPLSSFLDFFLPALTLLIHYAYYWSALLSAPIPKHDRSASVILPMALSQVQDLPEYYDPCKPLIFV